MPQARNTANVKNWHDGQTALRRRTAGMLEANKHFRKVNVLFD